jgi:beta-phosphoglucomutase
VNPKTSGFRFKAVIFDFDGVIVDTPKISFRAWKEVYGRNGIEFTMEDYSKYQGVRSEDKVPLILKEKGKYSKELAGKILSEREPLKRKYLLEAAEDILVPGALEFIKQLKDGGFRLALISSSLKENASILIKRFNVDRLFEFMIFGDEIRQGKPYPEIFLRAAEALNVGPETCLLFEDAVNGIRAAMAAGMGFIAVNTNDNHEDLEREKPLRIIKDFSEIDVEDIIGESGD